MHQAQRHRVRRDAARRDGGCVENAHVPGLAAEVDGIDEEHGIGLRRQQTLVDDARNAEALGYEFVSTGEHVFFHGAVANGLIALAAAAGATERINLMSAITLVPLYPPALNGCDDEPPWM